MKNERQEDILKGSPHEGSPTTSYDGCEHSATSSDLQRSDSHFFMKKKKKEGDVPKRETLGDYLQEYEAQSKEFKGHLNFQGFFKIKEERRSK